MRGAAAARRRVRERDADRNRCGRRLGRGAGAGSRRLILLGGSYALSKRSNLYTEFDINREPNNGRGPVDFKASFGAGDKSLIEFKLGSNRQLKRNLEKQVAIYEAANKTHTSVKVIVYYSGEDEARVKRIITELSLEGDESIVLIDARSDNKPSASKA